MDRNSIIGIVIIAAIIFIWGITQRPSKEEIERRKKELESQRQAQTEQRDTAIIDEQHKTPELTAIKEEKAVTVTGGQEEAASRLFTKQEPGTHEFYTLENDLMRLTISTLGGKPYSVELKDYMTFDSLPLILFSGDSTVFGLNFFTENSKLVESNDYYFTPLSDTKNIKVRDKPETLRFRMYANEGEQNSSSYSYDKKYIEYIYTLAPSSYMVDFSINIVGSQDIIKNEYPSFDLNWSIYMRQQEKGRLNENNYSSIYFKYDNDVVLNTGIRSKQKIQDNKAINAKREKNKKTQNVKWIAFKDQFFSSAIIAGDNFTKAMLTSEKTDDDSTRYLRYVTAKLEIPLPKENIVKVPLKFYFGPNRFNTLKKYKDLQLYELASVGKGISKWINQFVIIKIFNWLSRSISNYGIIILLLTIIVKVALFPLTYRSYLSQAKMKILKPQIDEINKKYPKGKEMDRQRATMDLYKKVGVSPLGGCLPMILQFPILFAMFRFFPTSIELRQQGFLWAQDLSTYDSILEWSGNIPVISKLYGNHISLFTLLMTISTILTMKLGGQATSGSQQMPGMKSMMYFMPIMFMFVLNNFSAGLTYYYFLANLITFGQNFLFKQFINEEDILKKMEAKKTKVKKKSTFQARLEKMAKTRGYKMPKK
jgi:YidC/Oxa1 family membrane protein insertase